MKLKLVPDEVASGAAEEEKPFWQQRRWQLSAAFLGLVVCTGLVAVLVNGGSSSDATVSGPTIGGLGPDGSRPQGCRTDDSDQRIPDAAPPDVTWRPLNGAQTPFSASAGPLKSTGPMLWCFAHTPMGAVMAAHVIPRHMSGPDWRTVIREQLVPGFGRDYFEAMRESLPETGQTRTTNTLAGFLVLSYSPATASIRVLVRQATVTYVSVDYTVDWDGVDWKLRPLSIGDLHTRVTTVLSLVGFALWKEG
ncbi:hypothetical protein GCM10022251_75720 [Phytohabitans flavus]|uniref:DUF8175 domain-containing protein n=1 Tax=Phytohabitans flavus TaxID=1076124 RepID=A0A6F8XMH3_9ACTN|nr:hypothetical protein [Phytohabitans flavus]BCB75007.1 hypothetical protein Pflav_014170 [Phytohabitans flavus]